MKRILQLVVLTGFAAVAAFADIHYVNINNLSPSSPYTNWATAATNIQEAINVAISNDTVLVTNGVYAGGGAFAAEAMNRVAITNAVTVRSVNGPVVTIIRGQGPVGDTAVRCAYVADGAALVGFTLTNGFTQSNGSGGGVFCDSTAGMISHCILSGNSASGVGGGAYCGTFYHCVLTGNSAGEAGGGAYSGAFYNCALIGNSAYYGGGTYYGTLYNCTLTRNSANGAGGGTYFGMLYNCIVYYNTAAFYGSDYYQDALNYCCTSLMPSSGVGNFTNAPGLTGLNNPRLTQGSPCIDAGHNDNVFTATDLDGEARTNGATVDVGCDEFETGSCTGGLGVVILTPAGTNAAVGYPLSFQADIEGRPLTYIWRFGDGVSVSNQFEASHVYADAGTYSVVLEAANLGGVASATVTVQAVSSANFIRYVSTHGNDAADGTSWATAKATIQAGIDVTIPGGLVLVSNGVYAIGGALAAGMMNRVAITKAATVRSVNGPAVTIIQGQGPMGSNAVRCAYATDGAALVGFTLTNGFTNIRHWPGNDAFGGGIFCEPSAVLSNCVLTGNSASQYGGGVYRGTLYNCTLTDNEAYSGGGAYDGTMYNCTLIGNSAYYGGGVCGGTQYNCIVYYNTATNDLNFCGGTFNYCCTLPAPGGIGNITNEPMFVSTNACNYRLQAGSPCINGGTNQDWMAGSTDLDGNPRIRRSRADMGAYESDHWGQFSDVDGDSFSDWIEVYRTGTDPTNAASYLGMVTLIESDSVSTGLVVRWQSAEGVRYRLKRSTNLCADAFGYLVRTNIVATPSINSETDTTVRGSGPWFYRVGVE